MIAEVAFPVPLHKNFHYKIPPDMRSSLKAGMRVKAPFGKRRLVGVVAQLHDNVPESLSVRLKEIESVVDPLPLYGPELMELAVWMSAQWNSPVGDVLSALLPACASPGAAADSSQPCNPAAVSRAAFELTQGQKSVLDSLRPMLGSSSFEAALLFGASVTGKTEVYIRLIREVLSGEGQALFLVPDIALTEPFLNEILSRFDPALTAQWHSRMTFSARRLAWAEIASGKKRVVLGTRSACLLPFAGLRLAVVDEEQDESYKQEDSSPNYHARDVVMWRARRHGALAVLGSATPSLESYQAAVSGKWRLLRLTERVSAVKSFPAVTVVDRRKEPGKLISGLMAQRLKAALERKEQAILLVNRKGYSGAFVCLNCGWFMRCERCGSVMGVYREDGVQILVCRRCARKAASPEKCPECSNRIFRQPGEGTQKVEHEIREIAPDAGILRLDADTSKKVSGEGRRAYKRFSASAADILVGTRIVSRGYHFPNVTFVGIIDADTELHSPDFRAAEKTVQLLCQAGGRAGRADKPGEIVIQSLDPGNYAFADIVSGDYEKFARHELEIRSQLGYPPFRRLLRCVVSSRNEKLSAEASEELTLSLNSALETAGLLSSESAEILGPVPCQRRKIAGWSRHHFIVKTLTADGAAFCIEHLRNAVVPGGVKIKLATDPYDFR